MINTPNRILESIFCNINLEMLMIPSNSHVNFQNTTLIDHILGVISNINNHMIACCSIFSHNNINLDRL